MVLDLQRLFENEGEEIPFNCSVDLSEYERDNIHLLQAPVMVSGRVYNQAGVVYVKYTARYTVQAPCDRCLAPVVLQRQLDTCQIAVRSLNGKDEDAFLFLPDAQLSVEEMVYADIVLDLPNKILCCEECKGLCPQCGVNLNQGACSCPHSSGDPRLAVLRDLLQ